MAFTVTKLGSMLDLQKLDPSYQQLSLADNVRSIRYEALLYAAENKISSNEKNLKAEDFFVTLPQDDCWLLTRKRMQAVTKLHEKMQQLKEEAAQNTTKENFLKGLLDP